MSVGDELQQMGQRPVTMRASYQLDHVARRNLPRCQHTQVPAGAPALLHPPGHVRGLEAIIELPAGLPPLAHFEHRAAHGPLVGQADLVFVQAWFQRQVFTERPRGLQA